MTSNEELLEEIKRLRLELQEIREIVNTLVDMVMETEEGEIEFFSPRDDKPPLYT